MLNEVFYFRIYLFFVQKPSITHLYTIKYTQTQDGCQYPPAAFFEKYFAGARQRPRGHLVPRIQQLPYLSGFLSLLYHFMNSPFEMSRAIAWGSCQGVPRPGPGAGSRGTKPWRHPTASPPRGPSAVDKRPSRPFGHPSLTQDHSPKQQSCKWLEA